jgi:hypothetical protein
VRPVTLPRPAAGLAPALASALALALAGGCFSVPSELPSGVASFVVQVDSVFRAGTRTPLDVVKACADRHEGTQDSVPLAERGTRECPYAIPRQEVDFEISAIAVDARGREVTGFSGPTSFRVRPGELSSSYGARTLTFIDGRARGIARAGYLFSETRLWVEDAPPEPILDGGVVVPGAPEEPLRRTYATGASAPIYFEEPTLQRLNRPFVFDNVGSPFNLQFVTVGRIPGDPDAGLLEATDGGAGNVLRQNCPDDPERHGKPATMVVTGIDCCGFFVHDVTACRVPEDNSDPGAGFRLPEPDGLYPGTFGSMYVYNYSHPDGIDPGDPLWSLAGSVQEFTGTTQITFASWAVAEKVRLRPVSEWNRYLSLVPVVDISMRTCGMSTPFIQDSLCGHQRANLKLESLESGLVRLRNAKLPDTFANCDFDGNGEVPFFCDFNPGGGQPRRWGTCGTFTDPDVNTVEGRETRCYIDCTIGLGQFLDRTCSEGSTLAGFGQLALEMAGPGPAWAGFDDTVPSRIETVTVRNTPARNAAALPQGSRARFICDRPVHYRIGTSTVVASTADPVQPGGQLFEETLAGTNTSFSFLNTSGSPTEAVTCSVAVNPRTRFLTILKDALPELNLQCSPDDPDPIAATQCRNLRGARYDIVGHLRQVQPARPRWMVIPRDQDDVCCRAGPGLSCPEPVKPCP